MSRIMPQDCEHGRTIDHGDFGDEWEPYTGLCPECMPADKCAELTEWYRLANRGWLEPFHREWYRRHDEAAAPKDDTVAEFEAEDREYCMTDMTDKVPDLMAALEASVLRAKGVRLERRLAEMTAERDRLRAAIDAIPRHRPYRQIQRCQMCETPPLARMTHRMSHAKRILGVSDPGV